MFSTGVRACRLQDAWIKGAIRRGKEKERKGRGREEKKRKEKREEEREGGGAGRKAKDVPSHLQLLSVDPPTTITK